MLRSVLALSTLAGLAAAQTTGPTGYGRFPCTLVNGDGSFSANPDLCTADALIAPGANDANAGDQGNSATPINPECVQQPDGPEFGYFCGITGARCTTDDNCDNGVCNTAIGQCQGGFTQPCNGDDTQCSGYLYCQTGDFTNTVDNTCGAVGAYCQDFVAGSDANTADQNQAIFNQFCGTGYCNSLEAACDVHAALGEDCSSDPDYKCEQGLRCDTTTDPANPVCVPALTPSAGSRARRDLHRKRNLCPASHEACSVPGSKGFECIDTTSNLEQCGACATAGGVDCTALPGVESVGCVAGTCEIWACAEGFSWDAASSSCQA